MSLVTVKLLLLLVLVTVKLFLLVGLVAVKNIFSGVSFISQDLTYGGSYST